ncbi:outer membrane protein assembly factor BamB [Kaarinaea lacus]
MRIVAIFYLVILLQACSGLAPKDYSGAKELESIESKLAVVPLWVKPTGEVPENTHSQLPPVLTGKDIYLANAMGQVFRMSAENGKVTWSIKLGDAITGGPGIGAGMLFVGTANAEIIGLDQETGQEKWRSHISSEMLSTPVSSNGSLFVQTIDGKITSIDVVSGKINWVYSHGTPKLTLHGTASPITVGDRVISGFADGELVSINTRTGELAWSTTINAPKGRTDLERIADIDGVIQASPDTVYVVSYQGRVAAVSITDGNIQWSRKMSSYNGLTYDGDHIYISDGDGYVWALDARTGATLWKQDGLEGREISAPEKIGNSVVVGDYDGYIHWLSVEDGQFIARQNLTKIWEDVYPTEYRTIDDEIDSQDYHRLVSVKPVAAGNTLFVRDHFGALIALRLEH